MVLTVVGNTDFNKGEDMARQESDQAFRDLGQIINDRWHETNSENFRNIEKLVDLAYSMFKAEEQRQKEMAHKNG